MTAQLEAYDITFDSPGNNDRAIVHCKQTDGRRAEVHFDITQGVARVRYAVVAGKGTVLFPDGELADPAKDALTNSGRPLRVE